VRLWDVTTGRQRATLRGHTDRVHCLAFSPDGATLASGGKDGTARLWDLATGKERARLAHRRRGRALPVFSAAFAPDGKTLATGSYDDQPVTLWATGTGKEQGVLTGHDSEVMALAFRRDGKALATASEDRTVKLWEVPTRKERASLRGQTRAFAVSFSPDGKAVAAGFEGGEVVVWDAETGQELATLRGHTGRVCLVAFSPDGKTLVSVGTRDGKVLLRDAPASGLLGK
jgi:WD40 repeat protein